MSKKKNEIDKNMILVEAGRFEMGEKPDVKHITISNDYYICKYPVTFAEYDEFCNEDKKRDNPEDGIAWDDIPWDEEGFGRGNRPVINITWYDAIEYCNWLSRKDDKLEEVYTIRKKKDKLNISVHDDNKWTVTCDFNKNGYRLPTEAEWEFAARGGNESKGYIYSGSDEINEVAWVNIKNVERAYPVGDKEKKPNELGIHDMTGNVEEWCWDWFSKDYTPDCKDPRGSNSGSARVVRGGCWHSVAKFCKVTSRNNHLCPFFNGRYFGFRISRTC